MRRIVKRLLWYRLADFQVSFRRHWSYDSRRDSYYAALVRLERSYDANRLPLTILS
jgi:hypothetical protein